MYLKKIKQTKPVLWKYLPIVFFFLLLIVVNFVVTLVVGPTEYKVDENNRLPFFIGNVAFLSGFCFVVMLWVKYAQKIPLTTFITSRKKISIKRLALSFFIWAGIIILLITIDYYLNPSEYIWNFNLETFIPFLIAAILLIPLQASFEEFLIRGQLFQYLAIKSNKKWVAIIITSIVFGLMHGLNPEVDKLGWLIMVFYIGTGIFLSVMTIMDQGLELALGFHISNNLITALLVTTDWTVFQTDSILISTGEPQIGMTILLPVFVLYPLLLWFFSRVYKWKPWKELLLGSID